MIIFDGRFNPLVHISRELRGELGGSEKKNYSQRNCIKIVVKVSL